MDGKLRNMTSIYLYKDNDEILSLYRINSRVVKESYIGTAGGHFENDELNDAMKCVLRELKEETGLDESDISVPELRYITLRNKKGEIRQNYYFFAKLLNATKEIVSNEGKLEWFKFQDFLNVEMPHTAKYVVEHYINIGRNTDKIYGGIAIEDGVKFTELDEFVSVK